MRQKNLGNVWKKKQYIIICRFPNHPSNFKTILYLQSFVPILSLLKIYLFNFSFFPNSSENNSAVLSVEEVIVLSQIQAHSQNIKHLIPIWGVLKNKISSTMISL